MGDHGGVWLVMGIQAAGKSTVADLLSRQFSPGVHIRGGQFYRWATSGWVHPGQPGRGDEARRLLDLRYRLSAMSADEYCAAGFTAVVQDNIFGADVAAWLDQIRGWPRQLVVLRPSAGVVADREAERHARTAKVAYRPGWFTIEDLDAQLAATPAIGLWLDTSEQSPEQTVREIMARRAEARVG